MKRIFSFIPIAALILSLLAGCGQSPRGGTGTGGTGDGKLSVVSTIFPGYDFTREVAGGKAGLTMLLPPGSESHSFEPTPQDVIRIQNCDIFIYVGGESDTWVRDILDSMDTTGMKIISMMDLVDVVEEERKEGMESGDDHEQDEEEAEYDEHVWTSPVNAMQITRAIADALCEKDETNADYYRENCAAYIEKLETLDADFRDAVAGGVRKTLIFGDRFPFRYFVDEYGLDYYAAFPGCSSDTESSAKTVAFLVDEVKAGNIPVVFYIEFSNEKMADTICEATAAKKLLFHSCHNVTKDDLEKGVTYLDLMTQNARNLREALS